MQLCYSSRLARDDMAAAACHSDMTLKCWTEGVEIIAKSVPG